MKPRRLKPAERKAKRRARGIPESLNGKTMVDVTRLGNSYSRGSHPEFVERGYYEDEPFICRDCGKAEVWTASQQKWWFEVAKGAQFTRASRCRNCRRRERERRNEARRIHLEGLAAKRARSSPDAETSGAGALKEKSRPRKKIVD